MENPAVSGAIAVDPPPHWLGLVVQKLLGLLVPSAESSLDLRRTESARKVVLVEEQPEVRAELWELQ